MIHLAHEIGRITISHAVWLLVLALLAGGGTWLLQHADAQARDTIRKHHLADIESALLFAMRTEGTVPPYDQPFWCGALDAVENREVRDQIEAALRAQHEKYANVDKPFPTDPEAPAASYFYYKRSPVTFELYAKLEAEPTADKTTDDCTQQSNLVYDYGINSHFRMYNPAPL